MLNGPQRDLGDPQTYQDGEHLDLWRRARLEHPIVRVESASHGSFWSVTTHKLGRVVLEDGVTFQSSRGMRLGSDPQAVAVAADRMLVVADGEAHGRLRMLHARWFTAKNLRRVEETLRSHLKAEIAPLVTGEVVDVVEHLADAVPICVMSVMLGIEIGEAADLSELVKTAFDEEVASENPYAARAASGEVFSYFQELIGSRRSQPGGDIVSLLSHFVSHGNLSIAEAMLNCDGLVNGGLGTSRHAVSGAVAVLAENPHEWRRLGEDRSLVRPAVEEVLRWTSPPMHMLRTASRNISVGSADVEAGERVVVWIPSCNRDEAEFANPDSFIVDRRPNRHLSLGAGAHYCIGAALGRLEIRVLLEVLLDQVGSITLEGSPSRQPSSFLNGLKRLDVRLIGPSVA